MIFDPFFIVALKVFHRSPFDDPSGNHEEKDARSKPFPGKTFLKGEGKLCSSLALCNAHSDQTNPAALMHYGDLFHHIS